MENVILNCEFCNYTTNRKFNLKRHHNAVHNDKTQINDDREKHIHLEGLVNQNQGLVNQKQGLVNQNQGLVNQNQGLVNQKNDNEESSFDKDCFYCSKCAKKYKTKKYLIDHEERCDGLNILTCKRCMFTFSSKASKSVHTRRNKCKAKSIIHAVNPDLKYNLYINSNNNNNTTINNIVNNFGSERTDYITFDDMMRILLHSGDSIIPKYIEFKHFNKKFPENHNIKYENNNSCLIKAEGRWKLTNIDYLSNNLINKNSSEICKYYNNQKREIEEKIKNLELIEFINRRFNYLDLSLNKEIYNIIKSEIKNIIKTKMLI